VKAAGDVFTKIYDQHYWISDESVSGHGSSLAETVTIRKELPNLLIEFDVKTMLDVPCGDYNWMQHVEFSGQYIGMDVVPGMIAKNNELYKDGNHKFVVGDIINDKLPCVDLVFCRDCLVHLPLDQAVEAVRRVIDSGSKYFAVTTCSNTENKDIEMGDWRPLNLCIEPFSFPSPVHYVVELEGDATSYGKTLGLWPIDELSDSLDSEFSALMEELRLC
jgi:SAM-dependent methyltransferase